MRYERKTMAQPLPLWQHLQVVLPRFIASEWCALLLDYDGTLTPIVTDPATAHLSPAMQQILTALAHRRVLRCIGPALEARALVLRTGKAVLEIRPAIKWDKGSALRWIVEHMCLSRSAAGMFPVYIGDDETDEDAFQALGAAGLG